MFVRRSKDNVGRRERTRAKRHATPKQSRTPFAFGKARVDKSERAPTHHPERREEREPHKHLLKAPGWSSSCHASGVCVVECVVCVRFGLSRSLSPPYHENRRKEKEIGRSVGCEALVDASATFIHLLPSSLQHARHPSTKMERQPTQALSLSR